MRLCPPPSFPRLGTQLFPPKPPDTPFPPGEAALRSRPDYKSAAVAGAGKKVLVIRLSLKAPFFLGETGFAKKLYCRLRKGG